MATNATNYRGIMFGSSDAILTIFGVIIGLHIANVNMNSIMTALFVTVLLNAITRSISLYLSQGYDTTDHGSKMTIALACFVSYIIFGAIIGLLYSYFSHELSIQTILILSVVAFILLGLINFIIVRDWQVIYQTPLVGVIGLMLVGLFSFSLKRADTSCAQ